LAVITEILHARVLAVALYLAEGVSDSQRALLFAQWERVTFRIFGLLQKDSRTKVGDYVRLASRIVKGDPNYQSFNQMMAALKDIGSEYPIQDAISQGFKRIDIYWQSPEVCRYILWNYEEALANSKGSNATIDEQERAEIWKLRAGDSIEHIFPQTPGSGWRDKTGDKPFNPESISGNVNRIGNLLLLPQPLNAEAKASPFKDKRPIYRKHHLRMIDEICALDDWTFDSIDRRELGLAEWATKRWDDI
jgi:hypothetical protein